MAELAAPSPGAELNHISQTALATAGLFQGRREFISNYPCRASFICP